MPIYKAQSGFAQTNDKLATREDAGAPHDPFV